MDGRACLFEIAKLACVSRPRQESTEALRSELTGEQRAHVT